jgi:hypothetical protein
MNSKDERRGVIPPRKYQVFSNHFSSDVYRVTSWKIKHTLGNMTYDNDGHLTVQIDGVYFVYSQMFYFKSNYVYTGFNVYIDNKIILKAICSVGSNPTYTHYIGGIFKITKGQRIWVGTTITRPFFFNEFSSFFGAYMIHSLPEVTLNAL